MGGADYLRCGHARLACRPVCLPVPHVCDGRHRRQHGPRLVGALPHAMPWQHDQERGHVLCWLLGTAGGCPYAIAVDKANVMAWTKPACCCRDAAGEQVQLVPVRVVAGAGRADAEARDHGQEGHPPRAVLWLCGESI